MKKLRQNSILDVVRTADIHSQDDLLKALRARGIRVTQSTLSRDIQELGLAKTAGVYAVVGQTPAKSSEDAARRILREFLVDVDVSGQLVVIKTGPGNAQTVAQAIDDMSWSEILGTVGGENTIFAATRAPHDAKKIVGRIRKLLR